MISPHIEIKKLLDEVGPTYYEHFVSTGTPTPFISYAVDGNREIHRTTNPSEDNLHYSRIEVYVKVWGDNLQDTLPLYDKADKVMIANGFTRASYNELPIGTNICLIGLYKGIGLEKDD